MIYPKITSLNESFLAELGRIVAHFAILENTFVSAIQGILKCSREECLIICCERSFHNLLDLAASLAKYSLANKKVLLKEFEEMINKAQSLENKRNAYLHSIYGMLQDENAVRSKTTAKRKKGLHTTHEPITPNTVRTTAMEIAYLATEIQNYLKTNKLGKGWI